MAKINKGEIKMTEVSAKEFGEVKATLKHVQKTTDKHTDYFEAINDKLDEGARSAVTHEQMTKLLEPVMGSLSTQATKLENHEVRIQELEESKRLAEASVWRKVTKSLETNIVNFIAVAIFGALIVIVYVAIMNMNNPTVQVIDKTIREVQ